MSYKKLGSHKQSGELFQRLLRNRSDHADAIEELAKYYEHKKSDLQKATIYTERGLQHLEIIKELEIEGQNIDMQAQFIYRLNRLRRKLSSESFPGREDS